ncbi:MAG: hypothetical protein U0Q07_01095 [Acidimicrobiales bacterium]
MHSRTLVTVLRSIIAVLLVAIGVTALLSGHLLIGLLVITFAALNVTRTVTVHKRRAELRERFPALAERRAVPRGPGGSGRPEPFRQPPVPSA